MMRRLLLWKLDRGMHLTRYAMYRELGGLFEGQAEGKRVLAVSGSSLLANVLGLGNAEIFEAHYPEHNIIDLKAFDDESFDYIVSDQVLEHVEGDPQRAFDESLRILKPGGIAAHTTAFIYPIHGAPSDFWRFTPDALRYLARGFSEILKCGGWGNRRVWLLAAIGLAYKPVPHAKWHPLHRVTLHNNPKWPLCTWVVARK
jgi:SAM-dependent methyltransferase